MAEVNQVLRKLKGVFPTSKRSGDEQWSPEFVGTIDISNIVFKLHSNLTFVALYLCSGLLFIQQIFKMHISCLLASDLPESAVTTYCFIAGTYTVKNPDGQIMQMSHLGSLPYLGVGTHIEGETTPEFHRYFQWVPFVLLLFGTLFRVPYQIWKGVEGGRLRKILSSSKESSEGSTFAEYIQHNKSYTWVYLLCEFGNLIVVMTTFWGLDWLLKGDFENFGLNYFRYLRSVTVGNPMDAVFPKVTKCNFNKFGPSGNIEKHDVMCILAMNVINEKIFLGIWIWLLVLTGFSVVLLGYRLTTLFMPRLRRYLLLRSSLTEDHSSIKKVLKVVSFPDWFVLKKASDHLTSSQFDVFCKGVLKSIESNKKEYYRDEEMKPLRAPKKDVEDPNRIYEKLS